MRPDDANVVGNVHGGIILKMIEEAGCIVCTRHCNTQKGVSQGSPPNTKKLETVYLNAVFIYNNNLGFPWGVGNSVRVKHRWKQPAALIDTYFISIYYITQLKTHKFKWVAEIFILCPYKSTLSPWFGSAFSHISDPCWDVNEDLFLTTFSFSLLCWFDFSPGDL